ncbi:MAG: helix-turn-helix transcriptional regulator [Microbacterium sp.]
MQGTQELVERSIRMHLASRKQTQAWLAKQLGVTPFWISRRLSGEIPFDLEVLDRIATVFGIGIDRMIADGDALSADAKKVAS